MESHPQMIVFTDLDGCLLDANTYAFEAAAPALEALRTSRIPLILTSSKTRAEIEALRSQLNHSEPFIAENGGGLFIPKGFFPFPLEGSALRGPYQVVEFGIPYARLRSALKEIEQAVGYEIRGFGDMPPEEVAARTGLSYAEAVLAKQRQYDEPFVIEGPPARIEGVQHEIEARGLRCTRGGRFYHLMGDSDKGAACRYLIQCYRRQHGELLTVAIGDSLNDLTMLAAVDRPFLVKQPDGSYEEEIRLPKLVRVSGAGPVGWSEAVLEMLKDGQRG